MKKEKKKTSSLCKSPQILWQIKTFPFDAVRRRSSALVLVAHEDEVHLWKVMKGAADGMAPFIEFTSRRKRGKQNYNDVIHGLESQGWVNGVLPENVTFGATLPTTTPKKISASIIQQQDNDRHHHHHHHHHRQQVSSFF